MKTTRTRFRAIALVLAMATVFLTSSFTAVAEDTTVNQTEPVTSSPTSDETTSSGTSETLSWTNESIYHYAINEIPDRREENVNIPVGFNVFSHEEDGKIYTLTAELRWYSEDPFDYTDVMSEINAGRPFLLGFGANAFYGGGHTTVCVGYEFSNGKFYVYVSDAWHGDTYRKLEFLPGPRMNDFIATVVVTEEE